MVERFPQAPRVGQVHGVQFTSASSSDAAKGLLGWVRFILNDLVRIDGVGVRRTLAGHLALSFPARRDRAGREHKLMRPVSAEVGREIRRRGSRL